MPQTPRAKAIIEAAVAESQRTQAGYVGTEHLLYGCALDLESISGRVLCELGATATQIQAITATAGLEHLAVSELSEEPPASLKDRQSSVVVMQALSGSYNGHKILFEANDMEVSVFADGGVALTLDGSPGDGDDDDDTYVVSLDRKQARFLKSVLNGDFLETY